MKPTFIALLALCLCLGGCGKKEPVQPAVSDLKELLKHPEFKTPPAKTEAQIEAETKAFAETKAKAEAGDAIAQYNLGVMYEKGQGVEQDFKEAVKWWQKAAD